MDSITKRLATFTSWPHHGQHNARKMAAAGFYQDHDSPHMDAASCFDCEFTLTSWATAEDPAIEHIIRQPLCAWTVRKTMNTQEKREDTFHDWPFGGPLSSMVVAAAGFYQSNRVNHMVSCYSCQLTLHPEELMPDPLQAHSTSLPGRTCAVVRRQIAQIKQEASPPSTPRGPASPTQQPVAGLAPNPPLSPPATPPSTENSSCGKCGKHCKSNNKVYKHLRKIHKIDRCRKCRKRFPPGESLSDHLLEAHAVPKVTKITKDRGKTVQLTGRALKKSKRGRRNRGLKARENPWGWMWKQYDDDVAPVHIKQEPDA